MLLVGFLLFFLQRKISVCARAHQHLKSNLYDYLLILAAVSFFLFSIFAVIVWFDLIGFAVSALASNWERLGKPFNPLLGETYEYQNDDFRIVCEQVSHHPPVSAFHADSSNFKFYGAMYVYIPWGCFIMNSEKYIEYISISNALISVIRN